PQSPARNDQAILDVILQSDSDGESGLCSRSQALLAGRGKGDAPLQAGVNKCFNTHVPVRARAGCECERQRLFRFVFESRTDGPDETCPLQKRPLNVLLQEQIHCQVECSRLYLFAQCPIGLHGDIQPNRGESAGEARQHCGQPVAGIGLGHTQAHRPGNGSLLEPANQQALGGKDLLRMAQEILAVFGERHASGGPLQQGAARLLFQLPDLMADGGLAEVHALPRLGEAAGVYDSNKGAQQVGVKEHRSNS
ncbi:hypothetical protein H2198_010294, partial [Neophaeococcomyces mojaviensis]